MRQSGTPTFWAPEQLLSHFGHLGPNGVSCAEAEIYSLGLIYAEIITGKVCCAGVFLTYPPALARQTYFAR